MVKAGGRKIRSENHELIKSMWNKEELPEEWKELIIVLYLSIRRVIKQTVVIIEAYQFCQVYKKILSNVLPSRLTPHAGKLLGGHQCGF